MLNTNQTPRIRPAELKDWFHDGREIALFDIREHGQYGEGHLFYAVPMPYSRLESDIERLAPRKSVRMVVYDDGVSGVAQRAAKRANALGYDDVHILDGGIAGWIGEGYELFAGVNTVGKTFGEIVEHNYATPDISADDLHRRLENGDNIVVIDGRPVDEYQAMNIPGSLCCPNGELVYRIAGMVTDPDTTIVINCAGRTRSLIGSQTLHNFGLPNPVLALRNGTMGWTLANLELEHGSARLFGEAPTGDALDELKRKAEVFAAIWNVSRAEPSTVAKWLGDGFRTTYLLDVRTKPEFDDHHCTNAVHAPGGQLLQAGDQWLGVRKARVVLVDDNEIRAIVVASWLAQIGWDVHVLRGGKASWGTIPRRLTTPPSANDALPTLEIVSATRLAEKIGDAPLLIDVRSSARFLSRHIEGSVWSTRPHAETQAKSISSDKIVFLIADEEIIGRAYAAELVGRGVTVAAIMLDGPEAWEAAGLRSARGELADAERIDFLFFVHDRHKGNMEAARQYLQWEMGLTAQLDERERAAFKVEDRRAASRA